MVSLARSVSSSLGCKLDFDDDDDDGDDDDDDHDADAFLATTTLRNQNPFQTFATTRHFVHLTKVPTFAMDLRASDRHQTYSIDAIRYDHREMTRKSKNMKKKVTGHMTGWDK